MAKSNLQVFKELVVKTTMEWKGGCQEGKAEFLESLDLDVPTEKHEITFVVEVPIGRTIKDIRNEIDTGTIGDSIADSLQIDYDDVKVSVKR